MDRFLVVFFGGGLGAMARYFVGAQVMTRYAGRFPPGHIFDQRLRFISDRRRNGGFYRKSLAHPNWRLFLVTGILGGYTTFSSFEYESYERCKSGYTAAWDCFTLLAASFSAIWPSGWRFVVSEA